MRRKHCAGAECEDSQTVFEFMLGQGYAAERLEIFKAGWPALAAREDLSKDAGPAD